MTLLHVCGRYLPLSETFTWDLIRRLTAFRHHVLASSLEHLDVFPLPSVHAPQPEADAWAMARRWNVDAVVCHFGPQCTMGLPIATMLDVPLVTVFHGYDISRLLRDRVWVERYRACFARGMRALCISEAGRRKLIDIGCPDEQTTVIRLGVDVTRFAYRPPSVRWAVGRPARVLLVARLVPKKGVSVALRALAALASEGCVCEVRIVGDGPLREALHAEASALGLVNVTWTGAVPHEVTQQAFAWADIYIQPSVTAETGDEEGIPVSIMEAMASGLPVVSTRHSGIPELVRDGQTGVLTDEGDAAGLARAVRRLLEAPDDAERLAQAGRAWVAREFNQDTQVARVGAWLHRVIEHGATTGTARPAIPGRSRRGLILQTIEPGLLARKLAVLTLRHPDVVFDIVAKDAAAQALAALPGIGTVTHGLVDTATGMTLAPTVRAALATAGYASVVVPWADDVGAKEQWACELAAWLRPSEVVGLTLRDREVPVTLAVPA